MKNKIDTTTFYKEFYAYAEEVLNTSQVILAVLEDLTGYPIQYEGGDIDYNSPTYALWDNGETEKINQADIIKELNNNCISSVLNECLYWGNDGAFVKWDGLEWVKV